MFGARRKFVNETQQKIEITVETHEDLVTINLDRDNKSVLNFALSPIEADILLELLTINHENSGA